VWFGVRYSKDSGGYSSAVNVRFSSYYYHHDDPSTVIRYSTQVWNTQYADYVYHYPEPGTVNDTALAVKRQQRLKRLGKGPQQGHQQAAAAAAAAGAGAAPAESVNINANVNAEVKGKGNGNGNGNGTDDNKYFPFDPWDEAYEDSSLYHEYGFKLDLTNHKVKYFANYLDGSGNPQCKSDEDDISTADWPYCADCSPARTYQVYALIRLSDGNGNENNSHKGRFRIKQICYPSGSSDE
jgi:hypothetical protein